MVPFPLEKDLVQGLYIQMDLDMTVIERSSYTVLDVLSDVGGLQGILISASSLVLGILNYHYLEGFLVSKLFKSKASQVPLKASKGANVKHFCIDQVLPHALVCCHRNRQQILMEKAYEALEKEVDIIRMIKSRRFVELALKKLLDKPLRKQLRIQSQLHEIDSQEEEAEPKDDGRVRGENDASPNRSAL